MKLEKTRDAVRALAQTAQRHYKGYPQERVVVSLRDDSNAEIEQAESLLRDAATLRVFAMTGLSAFHGRLCAWAQDGEYEDSDRPATECTDERCRAWAAALAKEEA